jgi:glycosyltransferase involved in cell wall biosynthesis
MIRDSDIVIFSLARWDAPYSSPAFSLAKEFANTNRVFYIDHPFSLKDFVNEFHTVQVQQRKNALLFGKDIYRKVTSLPDKLTMITAPLTLPINFLPQGKLYDFLSKVNDAILFKTLRRIIRDFNIRQFIYLNAFDPFFGRDFPPDIQPVKKIYQSIDDLTQAEYTAKHGTRLEEEIIGKFDLTLTTSQELKRLKSVHSRKVFLHPNAVDGALFHQALSVEFDRPKDLLPAVGKKIIGYTGNIESRIDYELLKKIIESHPDKFVVMVGPITNEEHKTIGLTNYPNVITTGSKKIEELPRYLKFFDCAIIPFKKNRLTRSIYPLKINEYLAAGRPVVATDFSEDIVGFGDVVYIGKTHEEFLQLIDRAIVEDDGNKVRDRIHASKKNTWKARVEQFWQILEGEKEMKWLPRR